MKFQAAIAFTYSMLVAVSMAQNPVDMISSQAGEQMNMAKGNLTQKAVQHILQGNLTGEHL